MTTNIALIGPNLFDQSKGTLHVHTATCRDGLNSRKYPQSYRHELEVDSRFDVVEFVYADHAGDNGFECGSTEYVDYLNDCSSDFYFHNCVSDLPAQTPEISEEPVPSPEPLINVLRDNEMPEEETHLWVPSFQSPDRQKVYKRPEESVQDFIERVASTVPKPEETLQCRQCGSSFTRTIVRGRKPHRCPTCKGGK